MSRRDFRVRVEDPRPTSAWLMVGVAGATLWITGQLAPWAVVGQAVAIVLSLRWRTDPHRWQRSPVALNVGMFAVVLGTIAVALRGEPSTIALAHFAALTQGLQLLDARPRRTEFLLVALALFQVVLASNLTDSVFFPPLLVLFLLATVWTLLVHTLRSEALEAGEIREVPRAITPGLLKTTLVASTLCLVLALALFVMLPRLRSSVVSAASLAPKLATAGFSDRVAFGELGRIRQDPTVVLRVETLEGRAPGASDAYWKGLAFDTFDGTAWSITPSARLLVAGSAEGGVELGRDPERFNLVQRIVREPVAAGVLFGIGEARGIQGNVRRLERDASGGLYATGQDDERVRYTLRSHRRSWHDAELVRDRAIPPRRNGARFLSRPDLAPEIRALASRITQGARRDAERVRAIERHLVRHGRYSDTPPAAPDAPGRSPIEAFLLGDMAGHCEYFATAMVLLARELGIPARLVNGFAGGRENRIGDFVELTRSDAHAWVEVHYERAGWVRYDPTPADLRARPVAALTLGGRVRELASALELWWFQRVVGFDRSDQISALKRAWLAWRDRGARARRREASPSAQPPSGWSLPGAVSWPALWLPLVAGAALLTALWLQRRSARSGPSLPPDYARALHLLARHGIVRAPHETARAFASAAAPQLPAAAATAFAGLTESYLAQRFGGRAPGETGRELRSLRRSLREHRSAWRVLPRRRRS